MAERSRDLLDQMLGRKEIGAAQVAAGRWYVRLCECAEIGGHAAIDYHRLVVHSGGSARSDRAIDASKLLDHLKTHLGQADAGLMYRCIYQGRDIEGSCQRERDAIRWCIKRALLSIVEWWAGYLG